jgi:uncharacterized protein YndB with AHSA1/START domain
MTQQATELTVRKSIVVAAAQERAFAVFTEQIGTWWPLEGKSIGAVRAETAVLEPFAGGRWFERGVDGSECDWGRVLVYDRPERVVLTWEISADWSHDPSLGSEVEVRFVPAGAERTRIELEHRGLAEAYGEQAPQLFAVFDSPGAWEGILEAFAAAA